VIRWERLGCATERDRRRWRRLRATLYARGQLMDDERETVTLAELERRDFAWATTGVEPRKKRVRS
jgi:hypothetical protein